MEEFVKKLVVELKKKIGDKYTIGVNKIVKVNDVILHSINFIKKPINLSPNIYLEGLYEKYLEGYSIAEIADRIIFLVENQFVIVEDEEKITEKMKNYQNAKNNIILKLINLEKSRRFLRDKVYKPFNDLAIVLYVMVRQDSEGILSVAITEGIMKQWGVSLNKLMEQAMNNMYEKFPIKTESLNSIMADLADDLDMDFESEEEEDLSETDRVYVMTNETKMNGAVSILYKGALENFALEFGVQEVIIVPSSCHEVLLIPKDGNGRVDERKLREMLREINESEVDPIEVLSNNVYIYNCETDEIIIWDEE